MSPCEDLLLVTQQLHPSDASHLLWVTCERSSTLFPLKDGESASYLCHLDRHPLRTDEDFNYVFIIKEAHNRDRSPAAKARDGRNKSGRRRSARPRNTGRLVMDAPCSGKLKWSRKRCAEDNDCYYGRVECSKWEIHPVSMRWGTFKGAPLVFSCRK